MDEMLTWTAIGALGQWFAGIATLVAVLYVVYGDYWKRPKLVLSFDRTKDTRDQLNTVGVEPAIPSDTISRWLRVRVENQCGRRVAKNCRAFLLSVKLVESSGKITDVLTGDVRALLWTNELPPQAARDLLPGVVHQIDIAGAVDGGTQFPRAVYSSILISQSR